MSRGLEIDSERGEVRRPDAISQVVMQDRSVALARLARPPDPRQRSATLPRHAYTLPRGPERERVRGRGRSYRVRDTESRGLVGAGTFRVVFERDLQEAVHRNDSVRLGQNVRHLARHGLAERHPSQPTAHVLVAPDISRTTHTAGRPSLLQQGAVLQCARPLMSLSSGARFGPYEVLTAIGAGGAACARSGVGASELRRGRAAAKLRKRP